MDLPGDRRRDCGADPKLEGMFTAEETKDWIGRRVQLRRKELGMSLRKLAQIIGMSKQYIYQIEGNHQALSSSVDVIDRLAEALGLSPSDLRSMRPNRKQRHANSRSPTSIGEFLAKQRLEQHLTLRELASMTGIPESTIALIEARQSRSRSKNLAILAQALGCNIPPELLSSHAQSAPEVPGTPHAPPIAAIPTTLGEFVAARRHDLGLTQTQVERRGKIPFGVLSKIEHDTYVFGRLMLAKLSRGLGCEIPHDFLPSGNLRRTT